MFIKAPSYKMIYIFFYAVVTGKIVAKKHNKTKLNIK